jgi:putative membrane protein
MSVVITKSDFHNVARGFLMGGADIIPGVSGGTVALVLGIYERLVTAISRFDMQFLALVRRKEFLAAGAHSDLQFLGALLAGIGTGIVGLASLMHYLMEHQQQHTLAAFFGLILASSYVVAAMIKGWSQRSWLIAGAAAAFAFWLVGCVPAVAPEGNAYVVLTGMIAICAMILPGISGAFIMLIMGKYHDITGILRSLAHFDISGSGVVTLLAFMIGAAVGLLSFSKVLHWLLDRYQAATMAALCGFMLGSLRKIWPFKKDLTPHVLEFKLKEFENVLPDWSDGSVWFSLLIVVIAAGFVLALDRFGKRTPTPTAGEPSQPAAVTEEDPPPVG